MLKIFGNGTDGVSWTPEPTSRGTFSILSSCVLTILLCVWSAIHLNIPRHEGEGKDRICWRCLRTRIYWLIFALVAPELVAYTAYHQNSEAVKFRKFFRKWKAKQKRRRGGEEEDIADLSMAQAFHAIMGGYQIYVPGEGNPFPGHRTHFPLARETLQDLAKTWPHIFKITPRADVDDKNKENSLARVIVCVQASWFILQCITRMALSFSITILELNAFGHCLCALLIYYFWWSKPLDVRTPTLITGPEAKSYAAYLWLTSSRNGTEFTAECITPMSLEGRNTEIRRLKANGEKKTPKEVEEEESKGYEEEESKTSRGKTPQDDEAGIGVEFPQTAPVEDLYLATDVSRDQSSGANFTAITSLAAPLIKKRLKVLTIAYNIPDNERHQPIVNQLDDIPPELSSDILLFDRDSFRFSKKLSLCLYSSGVLYGGLHVLAWSATFRSPAESLLWQISSVTVVSAMPVAHLLRIAVGIALKKTENRRKHFWGNRGVFIGSWSFVCTLWLTFGLCCITYFLARAYLVVECFIALAHSPVGVYEVPQWSNYVPHIR